MVVFIYYLNLDSFPKISIIVAIHKLYVPRHARGTATHQSKSCFGMHATFEALFFNLYTYEIYFRRKTKHDTVFC